MNLIDKYLGRLAIRYGLPPKGVGGLGDNIELAI